MTTKVIFIGVVAAAVIVGAIWWLRSQGQSAEAPPERGRAPRPGQEGPVVLLAFGADWAKRFGCTEEQLSDALIAGADATLAMRVNQEVGVIDLRFEGSAGGSDVVVSLLVTYSSTDERATARLTLGWDDVPRDVRGSLLRAPGTPVFRKWRALP